MDVFPTKKEGTSRSFHSVSRCVFLNFVIQRYSWHLLPKSSWLAPKKSSPFEKEHSSFHNLYIYHFFWTSSCYMFGRGRTPSKTTSIHCTYKSSIHFLKPPPASFFPATPKLNPICDPWDEPNIYLHENHKFKPNCRKIHEAIRDSQHHSPLRSRQSFVGAHLPHHGAAGQSATIGTLMHAHNNHKLINAYEKKTTVVRISVLEPTKRLREPGKRLDLVGGFLAPKRTGEIPRYRGEEVGVLCFQSALF